MKVINISNMRENEKREERERKGKRGRKRRERKSVRERKRGEQEQLNNEPVRVTSTWTPGRRALAWAATTSPKAAASARGMRLSKSSYLNRDRHRPQTLGISLQ